MEDLRAFPGLESHLKPLQNIAAELWRKGWAERNAGNVSVDVTDSVALPPDAFGTKIEATIPHESLAGREFLVTATGSRFRDLAVTPERCLLLVRIDPALDGYVVLWGGVGSSGRATSEFISHLKIHERLLLEKRPYRTVLHTHPQHLIALTHLPGLGDEAALNMALWSMHPEVSVFVPDGVGWTVYRRPGTEDLADVTSEAFRRHRIVLWEKHGVVALGRDVSEAFDLIDTVNKAAEIYLLCKGAGVDPEGLPEQALVELEETFGSSLIGEDEPEP